MRRQREPEPTLCCAAKHAPRLVADLERRPGRSAIDFIGETYKLTPAEARILRAVVEVGGISDIATALSISPTTVKTHLRHVFQKAGLKGQVDLIRLVALTATRTEE